MRKSTYNFFLKSYIFDKDAVLKLMNINKFKISFLNYFFSIIKMFFYEVLIYKKYDHFIFGDNIFYNLLIAKKIIEKYPNDTILMAGSYKKSSINEIFLSSREILDFYLSEFGTKNNKVYVSDKLITELSSILSEKVRYLYFSERVMSTNIITKDGYSVFNLKNIILTGNEIFSQNENTASFHYWGMVNKKHMENKFIHKILTFKSIFNFKEFIASAKLVLAKKVYLTNMPENQAVFADMLVGDNMDFSFNNENILSFGEAKYIIKEKQLLKESIISDIKDIKEKV